MLMHLLTQTGEFNAAINDEMKPLFETKLELVKSARNNKLPLYYRLRLLQD